MPSVAASRTQTVMKGGGGEGHHYIQEPYPESKGVGHC